MAEPSCHAGWPRAHAVARGDSTRYKERSTSGYGTNVGYVDFRFFTFIADKDSTGNVVAQHVVLNDHYDLPVRIADVIRVNALAVPLRAPLNYEVLRHELRLVLSFLPDQVDQPLCLRQEQFRSSASHIQRFVTESFGLGMLTAAVESEFGWKLDERSLDHFDVLPTELAGLYKSMGPRPDLLFRFNGKGDPWRLAGEARGRSARRPKANTASAAQQRRLNEILGWSARHEFHPVTMTWTYTGSSTVEVDLFVLDKGQFYFNRLLDEMSINEPEALPLGLSPPVIAARAEKVLRQAADDLYRTAPDPVEMRPVFNRRVRGDWVRADLVGPSNAHLFLGILDNEISTDQLASIRRHPGGLGRSQRTEDPIQVDVMGRIMIAIALGLTSPPPWSDIIDRFS